MSAHQRPLLASAEEMRGGGWRRHARRLAACAASLALAAVASTGALSARGAPARASALVERLPDTGEDYFSAIEQPHKIYEWPWLKDQKFQYEARVLGYGPPETWDRERDGHLAHNAYMGWNHGYKRTAFDEVRCAVFACSLPALVRCCGLASIHGWCVPPPCAHVHRFALHSTATAHSTSTCAQLRDAMTTMGGTAIVSNLMPIQATSSQLPPMTRESPDPRVHGTHSRI